MKERPILFSGPMVRAILEGRKTQTRRIMSNQPAGQSIGPVYVRQVGDGFQWHGEAGESSVFLCPYGKPGDRLWVRETWRPFYESDTGVCGIQYRGGGHEEYYGDEVAAWSLIVDGTDRWRPSIHMPRWASRITLEVESVRVERLQDISESDAIAEGVHSDAVLTDDRSDYCGLFAYDRYAELWESINGPGSWEANPYVWVVTFKPLTPTTP